MDIIPKVTKALNHTVSTVTGMKPIDINPKNAQEVRLPALIIP